jgi:RNA polymerase sigma factor (sigma-70 family)
MPPDLPVNSPATGHPEGIDPLRLFSLCAENAANRELWGELLRRYTPLVKAFIRRCLGRPRGDADSHLSVDEVQESDLFQNVIVRLVKNDCAVMKQFLGEKEEDLLAYLAVITRSVVRDCQRSQWALKRASDHADTQHLVAAHLQSLSPTEISDVRAIERRLPAREVVELSAKTLQFLPGPYLARDRLIFQLYFLYNLSADQIWQCKGINLSKAGVEKVLNRLKERIRVAQPPSQGAEVGQ